MNNVIETNIVLVRRYAAEKVISGAKRWIWATFNKEGIHCYPAAATDPALAEGI